MPMAKRSQLVSQHLENISSEALDKYQDVIRGYVRGRQGIYALYRRNKLYYVGLASNLRNRLQHHLRDRHKGIWDRFSVYLTIGDSHLKELESLILRTVKPRGNSQSGKFIKSENLRGRLARDLRAKHREELNCSLEDQPRRFQPGANESHDLRASRSLPPISIARPVCRLATEENSSGHESVATVSSATRIKILSLRRSPVRLSSSVLVTAGRFGSTSALLETGFSSTSCVDER